MARKYLESLWFADAIARLVLFVPYLRTYWRAGDIDLEPVPIPPWLPRDRKYKLRNSLVFWDSARNTIWLRGRGFNFLRTGPAVVTILIEGDRVIDGEIRFSSATPFVFVLFFVSAYLMFSQSMPGGASSAAAFVGFAVVVFSISIFIQRNRFKSRVEQLAMDALAELRETKG